jgi:2,4-dienoyl-CoA reductase-like NADH-dependent reductase (Old Yellow Enzyme family)
MLDPLAAMSEGLADADNQATPRLEALYRRWANSGTGLLFSGNFQVDRWHLGGRAMLCSMMRRICPF